MALDTELLGSCGLLLKSEIYSSDGYILARVSCNERELVAEISSGTGFKHRWPSVRGLILPLSARDLPGGRKLLLFDPGHGRFLSEVLLEDGSPGIQGAIAYTRKILKILTDLQSAGMICGYLGPEMFFLRGDELFLLAGRRGVPAASFTPPEAIDARPSDPRSDVWAIATLMFRIIAATDEKDQQVNIWKRLPDHMKDAIGAMAAPNPKDRPPGLIALCGILDAFGAGEPADDPTPSIKASEGFKKAAKPPSRKRKPGGARGRSSLYIKAGIALAIAASLYLIYTGSGLSQEEDTPEPLTFLPDSVTEIEPGDGVSPWADIHENTIHIPPSGGTAFEDTARVWISNCTGVSGAENQFRAGPASEYSHVYPLVGATGRRTSLILARRPDPLLPVEATDAGRAALAMADTLFTVKPVDLTILLGTDLRYAEVNPQFFTTPSSPAGTLFVDVVNHGIQYPLEGLGAATWAAGMLDGRSCRINDTEWLVKVSDIRDADRYNEEIGIPNLLQETLFLRHASHSHAETLELLVRQYFRALPLGGTFVLDDVPVPHIHVLMGSGD